MTSLYTRMRTHGTLTETPDEIPDAVFARASTFNWMRAEAIPVSDFALDFSAAQAFFGRVQRKELSERQLNSVFRGGCKNLNGRYKWIFRATAA